MEHLAIPLNQHNRNTIHVAYLGRLCIPRLNFVFHPEFLHGVDDSSGPMLAHVFAEDADDVHWAYIQAELYFDLLQLVFGHAFVQDDFIVVKDDGRHAVTTSRLPAYIEAWKIKMSNASLSARQDFLRAIGMNLKSRWYCCDMLDTAYSGMEVAQAPILLSTRMLVQSLIEMVLEFEPSSKETRKVLQACTYAKESETWTELPMSYGPLAAPMTQLGWCFPEIIRMLQIYKLTTILYLMHFRNDSTNHENCYGRQDCVSRNIDRATYRPQHISPSCVCEPVGPNSDFVAAILATNRIPLVKCSVSKSDKITIKVIPATRMKRHIAVSHVWADGLAIPTQNKMFKCQLLALFKYMLKARKAYMNYHAFGGEYMARTTSLVFWLDVFCIPDANEQARRTAISMINPTFAGAYVTLIYDKSLVHTEDTNRSAPEQAARLAVSNWMSRSWTFLEASLGINGFRYVCIAGHVVDFEEVGRNLRSATKPEASYLLISEDLKEALNVFDTLRVWTGTATFYFVWNALAERTLSHPKEIWAIAAILLGYNAGEVVSTSVSQPLLSLLTGINMVPSAFIFKNITRSDSNSAEIRWLPTQIDDSLPRSETWFPITDRGIVLRSSRVPADLLKILVSTTATHMNKNFVLVVDDPQVQPVPEIHFHIEIHNLIQLNTVLHAKQGSLSLCFVLHAEGGRTITEVFKSSRGEGACLLVKDQTPPGTVYTEFVSSLTYNLMAPEEVRNSLEGPDPPSTIKASGVAAAAGRVILLCGRENWYKPRFWRKEVPLSFFTSSVTSFWIFYAVLPGLLMFGGIAIGAIVASKRSGTEARVIPYWTSFSVGIAGGLLFLYGVIWFERLVFENWVRSFREDKTLAKWWQRIMP